jgi:hypothetical protein
MERIRRLAAVLGACVIYRYRLEHAWWLVKRSLFGRAALEAFALLSDLMNINI